jgi:hypothetical protein
MPVPRALNKAANQIPFASITLSIECLVMFLRAAESLAVRCGVRHGDATGALFLRQTLQRADGCVPQA